MALGSGRRNVADTKRRQGSEARTKIDHYPGQDGGAQKRPCRLGGVVWRLICRILNAIPWRGTTFTILYFAEQRNFTTVPRLAAYELLRDVIAFGGGGASTEAHVPSVGLGMILVVPTKTSVGDMRMTR